jgi:hypothetical protein
MVLGGRVDRIDANAWTNIIVKSSCPREAAQGVMSQRKHRPTNVVAFCDDAMMTTRRHRRLG